MLRISTRAREAGYPFLKHYVKRSMEKLAAGQRTHRRLMPKDMLPAYDMVRKIVGSTTGNRDQGPRGTKRRVHQVS